jgi:membrane associated rhomboid family serine protease
MSKGLHVPYRVFHRQEWYRMLTSGFLHAGWLHLGINMFVFWTFGKWVERAFGQLWGESGGFYFLLLYLGGIVFSDIPTLFKQRNNPQYASLGASGAVSAVLFAFILFNPWSTLYIWGIIPIPGIVAGFLYLVYSARMAKKGMDGVNHDAHFYGAVFGLALPVMIEPKLLGYFVEALLAFDFSF